MQRDDHSQPEMPPSVFLSYTRGDQARARQVIDLLEANGFDVWWDGRLEGGENYLQTTETALETSDCVVVLWSAAAVASHWVRDEAQRGRERGCLVPLTIDGTMAPLGFRQFQLLDISGWDGAATSPEAARIMVAVRAKAGAAPVGSTPILPLSAPTQVAAAMPQTSAPALSRRTLMIGGAGLVGAAGVLGAWQFGMFASPASAAISMVVLPFANQTGDPERKYFSDGLARELRTVLSQNPRLKVSAPTSSSAIASEDDFAIGRKLGVGHILRGSVQRDTARVRVTTELVAIEDGLVRWAETYDRALEDVFAVQTEIAQTVALSLVAEVAGEREAAVAAAAQQDIGGTENVVAYEAFLRGFALYDLSAGADSDRAALAQFEAAIAADPDYAAAHAMRATMLSAVANLSNKSSEMRDFYRKSEAVARHAIALEPKLAWGHLALGFSLNNGQLNRRAALPHYQAAEKLAPGDGDALRSVANFYSYGAAGQGGPEKAQAMITKVIELDPLNARAFRSAGYIALFARDYPAAITQMERALALNPSLAGGPFLVSIARLLDGDAAGGLKTAKAEPVPVFRMTATAIAAARLGDTATADAAFAQMVADYGDAGLYQQAQVQAQRDAPKEALTTLERAYVALDPGVLWATNDPLLDPLRGEARFQELLLRLGS